MNGLSLPEEVRKRIAERIIREANVLVFPNKQEQPSKILDVKLLGYCPNLRTFKHRVLKNFTDDLVLDPLLMDQVIQAVKTWFAGRPGTGRFEEILREVKVEMLCLSQEEDFARKKILKRALRKSGSTSAPPAPKPWQRY